jgi:acyl-CoA-binding protein
LKQEELSLNNQASVGNNKGIKGGVVDTKTRTSHISWIPFKK